MVETFDLTIGREGIRKEIHRSPTGITTAGDMEGCRGRWFYLYVREQISGNIVIGYAGFAIASEGNRGKRYF